jgi:hypothetical protein
MTEPVLNDFDRATANTDGCIQFVLCPHLQKTGEFALTMRLINLIDEPGRTVTLALCGVCVNVVTGCFVADIVRTITDQHTAHVGRWNAEFGPGAVFRPGPVVDEQHEQSAQPPDVPWVDPSQSNPFGGGANIYFHKPAKSENKPADPQEPDEGTPAP